MSPGYNGERTEARGSAGASGTSQRAQGRVRVALVDRDSGFFQVLSNRLEALGWEQRLLPGPVSADAIVAMRLNALIVDLAVVGPSAWEYLDQICTRLPNLAVIVCTAPSSVSQRVRGLRLGADAWMTKPCHPEELVGVIEAALRRHRRSQIPGLEAAIRMGEVTIRPDRYQAFVDEESLELTAREFQILHLLSRSDRVLRREEIYERVWGYAMAHGDRSVDVFVRKLRQKLRSASPEWNYIHTHFGVGYRVTAERDGAVVDEQAGEPGRGEQAGEPGRGEQAGEPGRDEQAGDPAHGEDAGEPDLASAPRP
jgi:DNA-binding response OmpR family regulator